MIRLLIVIAAAVGIFYYTNAGDRIMGALAQLEPACNQAGNQLSPAIAGRFCGAIGNGVRYLDQAAGNFKGFTEDHLAGILNFGRSSTLEQYSGEAVGGSTMAQITNALSSSAQALQEKINAGPLAANSNEASPMQRALDDFTIGQRYKNEGGADNNAVSWFQQGAATPGYGVMSQISLGDMYRSGGDGVSADPQVASNYYAQALQSINLLEGDRSAQAKQILQSFGGSTEQLKQQLQATINSLKGKK